MGQGATLLLVHGAWSGGWPWEPVLGPLRERGLSVQVIEQLPSGGIDAAELADLSADVEYARARLAEITGPVVLCGHSYGGMVITEFADYPAAAHSVYVTAFWPGEGQSLTDLVAAAPTALTGWIVVREDGSLAVTNDVARAHQALFADLDSDHAARVHERLVLQSATSFTAPSNAPARSHPTTYVLCTGDQAISLAAQEAMSAAADTTVQLHSAHYPQLSQPAVLADVLAGVAEVAG
jgi:pimeloyl-ACP methyl ester carboxylesterase